MTYRPLQDIKDLLKFQKDLNDKILYNESCINDAYKGIYNKNYFTLGEVVKEFQQSIDNCKERLEKIQNDIDSKNYFG